MERARQTARGTDRETGKEKTTVRQEREARGYWQLRRGCWAPMAPWKADRQNILHSTALLVSSVQSNPYPCLGASGRDRTGNQPGLPRETLRTRSPTLPSAESAAARGSPCICVCMCAWPPGVYLCVHVCGLQGCVCVCARACGGGIAGQEEPESCALAFRSTPFLLGLSCGWGCPLGVERGARPLL